MNLPDDSLWRTLPLLVLVWPLLLAVIGALPPCRRHALRLLPLAPLPALALVMVPGAWSLHLPDLLLGARLELTPGFRWLLGMTATVWLFAGLFAQTDGACGKKPAILAGFWCLTLSGNLGVFLAADVVTFYVAFAVVSLASYALVVHKGDADALRAGRVYLCLAVLGEVALLAGLLFGVAGAESVRIAEVREALGRLEYGTTVMLLLMVGFGIKAGLLPLHLWLPLAHPAAPTPASAVLSGAIVKAGIAGCLLFLGAAGPGLVQALAVLGMAGALLAALLGLTQWHPKAILAYSTVSQMSLLVAVVALLAAQAEGQAPAVLYATHHGLAKAALFLGVAWWVAASPRWRLLVLTILAIAALSIAGLPYTGGGLAKLGVKLALPSPFDLWLGWSAIPTALVLGWFLCRLPAWAVAEAREHPAPPSASRLAWICRHAPVGGLLLLALVVPWVLWPAATSQDLSYPLQWHNVWTLSWPVVVGGLLATLAWHQAGRLPRLPAGDMLPWLWQGVVAGLAPVQRVGAWLQQPDRWRRPLMQRVDRWLLADAAWLARREQGMQRWRRSSQRMLWLLGLLLAALVVYS